MGKRWLRRVLRTAFVAAFVAVLLLWLSTDRLRGFGGRPSAERMTRIQQSPHFKGGRFVNDEAAELMKRGSWEATKHWFTGDEMRSPTCPLPLVKPNLELLRSPPEHGLRVTWLGHSTTLIEIDGVVILTDPNWSERASPSRWVGPKRFHPPPIPIKDLPRVDAVVISHEHFDHLDMETVRALAKLGIEFHVPLGVGAHLDTWGVPLGQIIEHDWWQSAAIGSQEHGVAEVISTPARHFNGRGIPLTPGSLWTSWSIKGAKHKVFFSGDTGFMEAFREIGSKHGPFDVALLEIGQYHPSWGDIHLGPAGAIDAQERLGAKRIFPIHWGTFELAMHDWSEPAETLMREAERRSVTVIAPRLGEPVDVTGEPFAPTYWWRALPPVAKACP